MDGERLTGKPAHDTAPRLVAGPLPRGLAVADASRLTRQLARDWLGVTIAPRAPAGGAPRFAPGWIGSLSHAAGAAAVLVLPEAPGNRRTCGVDIEPLAPLPPEVAGFALTPAEQAWVAHRRGSDPAAGRRLFSAKECVHKAVHPVAGAFLEFDEVEIVAMASDDGLKAWHPRPVSDAARRALAGWTWAGGWQDAAGFGLAWLLGTGGEILPVTTSIRF